VNFTFSALLGPVFGGILQTARGEAIVTTLAHYQLTFEPFLYGLGFAIVLTPLLKETGRAVRPPAPAAVGCAS
jgi:hypothetical protein